MPSWRAYCCTDVNATVAEILEAVADRAAIEQDFHDLKEVHGVGQQQLRVMVQPDLENGGVRVSD